MKIDETKLYVTSTQALLLQPFPALLLCESRSPYSTLQHQKNLNGMTEARIKRNMVETLHFVDIRKHITREFASSGPEWYKTHKGMTLLGRCGNPTCDAFSDNVCIHRGYGKFDIMKESVEASCPACEQAVGVVNVIFSNCVYQCSGRVSDGVKLATTTLSPQHLQHHIFPQNDELCLDWEYLTILVFIPRENNINEQLHTSPTDLRPCCSEDVCGRERDTAVARCNVGLNNFDCINTPISPQSSRRSSFQLIDHGDREESFFIVDDSFN